MSGLYPVVLPSLKSSTPKFQGYRIHRNEVQFYWTGLAPTSDSDRMEVRAYYDIAGGKGGKLEKSIQMQWNGHQWNATSPLPLDDTTYYRFVYQSPSKGEQYLNDLAYTTRHNDGYLYNVIQSNAKDPSSNGSNLLVFPDSFLKPKDLNKTLTSPNAKRNFFNHFNGGFNKETQSILNGLFRHFGFQMQESRPIIGGHPTHEWDKTGSHGYWSTNLFLPSSKIRTEADFRTMALGHLHNGVKLCFDGAFVSEGLNGIHFLSNLRHGSQSSFENWFTYNLLKSYPENPLKIGVLPVKKDPVTGDDEIDNSAWDIRFIPPIKSADEPQSTWFVELYDPRLETPSGAKRPSNGLNLASAQSSVQNYRFPISGEEVKQKKQQLESLRNNPEELKLAKRYWQNFHLESWVLDNSGSKWDGQRDQVRLRIKEHKVIQDYIQQALHYWTDKVDRLYVQTVAKALEREEVKNPKSTWMERIDNLMKPGRNGESILPPIRPGEKNVLDPDRLNRELSKSEAILKNQQKMPATLLREEIQKHFLPETLPASPVIQIILATDTFHKILQGGYKPPIYKGLERLFTPVRQVFNTLFPDTIKTPLGVEKSFYDQLEVKLNKIFNRDILNRVLSVKTAQELADPNIAHLYYEDIAKSIFLSLLTGKYLKPQDIVNIKPEKLAAWMDNKVPSYILLSPPKQGAKLMADWLEAEFNKLDLTKLKIKEFLEGETAKLSSDNVAVAKYIINQHQLGLHWRIDAMKDVGNIAEILSLPEALKTKELQKTVKTLNTIFDGITDSVRSAFPNSIIRPEISNIYDLTSPPSSTHKPRNEQEARDLQTARDMQVKLFEQDLLGQKRFDGMTNFEYYYAPYALVRCRPRPDDPSAIPDVLSPSKFIYNPASSSSLKNMMKLLHYNNVLQYQNITTNHDMATSLYGLTLHPIIARHDYLSKYRSLLGHPGEKGPVTLAIDEVQYKTGLGLNAGLNEAQFTKLREKLKQLQETHFNNFSPVVQPFIKNPSDRLPAYRIAIPAEASVRYIQESFKLLKPNDIGVTPEQFDTLRQNILLMLTETSELKAVRARLINTLDEMEQNPALLAPHVKTSNEQAANIIKHIKPHFTKALLQMVNDTPYNERRWLGYQQFDYVIDKLVNKLPASALPQSKEQTEGLKQGLYTAMIQPALEQYKRMASLLVAIPGDPTFYMPDLYGQAGGENFKNMYLGNRELIRYDWLEKNPVIKKYHDELASIVRLRKDYNALNNGQLILPLDPETNPAAAKILDDTGIIPLIRDDGEGHQVISLLNTGKPQHAWDTFNQATTAAKYPEAKTTQPVYKDYKLDLSALRIAPGTRYKAVDSESGKTEYFIVNPKMQLVSEADPNKGIDIKIHRLLAREAVRSTRFDSQLPQVLLDAIHQAESHARVRQKKQNPFKLND